MGLWGLRFETIEHAATTVLMDFDIVYAPQPGHEEGKVPPRDADPVSPKPLRGAGVVGGDDSAWPQLF